MDLLPPHTQRTLVICLAMRPVMNFMGYLFREEGADSDHNVTGLIQPNSPDHRVARFLVNMLARLDDDFWLVYAPDGWDNFHLHLAMDTFLTIAAGIWWRVGQHLHTFPWRLWHVVNPDSSEESRRAFQKKVRYEKWVARAGTRARLSGKDGRHGGGWMGVRMCARGRKRERERD